MTVPGSGVPPCADEIKEQIKRDITTVLEAAKEKGESLTKEEIFRRVDVLRKHRQEAVARPTPRPWHGSGMNLLPKRTVSVEIEGRFIEDGSHHMTRDTGDDR